MSISPGVVSEMHLITAKRLAAAALVVENVVAKPVDERICQWQRMARRGEDRDNSK
jgi:hypothetical protein